jgi:hypothetical protein
VLLGSKLAETQAESITSDKCTATIATRGDYAREGASSDDADELSPGQQGREGEVRAPLAPALSDLAAGAFLAYWRRRQPEMSRDFAAIHAITGFMERKEAPGLRAKRR